MNEPLTLEQLRNKLGKPIFLETGEVSIKEQLIARWTILENWDGPWFDFYKRKKLFHEKDYGITWLAYAYPPAHIDREAWEPCEMCGGKKALYQHTTHTKLYMNTFGEAATLVTECMACPPYADCCMKNISANSAFKINFCPNCGRPLTEEAWKELEKRVRGER